MRIITKLLALNGTERALLWRAWIVLWTFRVALWLVPLPHLKAILERVKPRRTRSRASKISVSSAQLSPAQIGRAIGAMQRFVPRPTCLVQALAADFLLRREEHRTEFHVGVVKNGGQLLAHAWVESAGEVVVGGGELKHFTPILRWENEPCFSE